VLCGYLDDLVPSGYSDTRSSDGSPHAPIVRAYGTGIRTMAVGRHLFWSMTNHSQSLLKKLFCRIPIPLLDFAMNLPDCHRDH